MSSLHKYRYMIASAHAACLAEKGNRLHKTVRKLTDDTDSINLIIEEVEKD